MIRYIYRWIRRIIYQFVNRNRQISLQSNCMVCKGSFLEGKNLIGCNSTISGQLGRGSYIGKDCIIRGKVGRYCSISNHVCVVIGKHPIEKYVSTHPCFYSVRKQAGFSYVENTSFEEITYAKDNYHIIIGNDVWIGENVLIYSGITIGDGAVIAAGAIVNQDVDPYTIVGGVPARVLKKRFSENQIEKLLDIKWWNYSEAEIIERIDDFNDINIFLSRFGGDK